MSQYFERDNSCGPVMESPMLLHATKRLSSPNVKWLAMVVVCVFAPTLFSWDPLIVETLISEMLSYLLLAFIMTRCKIQTETCNWKRTDLEFEQVKMKWDIDVQFTEHTIINIIFSAPHHHISSFNKKRISGLRFLNMSIFKPMLFWKHQYDRRECYQYLCNASKHGSFYLRWHYLL